MAEPSTSKLAPTEEDIAWFKSTFHPIPKAKLPDDCIEYTLYMISHDIQRTEESEIRSRLRAVQKHASALQKKWLKDYIWQRQSFTLELVHEDGLNVLHGRTEYGDSIEDEWVIVWLLRELSQTFPALWVKVTDTDGEFLLIEASGTIPAWLEPDVAENRVWINDGQLRIIRPQNAARSLKRTSEKLSFHDAQSAILQEPKRIMHSTSIEEEAFYRIRNYPQQIQANMHHALLTLPRKVVFLLLQKAAYVAPAIEAFYLRDPIALKPLHKATTQESLIFPPLDLVTVSARFPRPAYAQLKSQDFPEPPIWRQYMPSRLDTEAYVLAETGMKLTSGFEMLLTDPQHQDRPAVREMKLLLDDLASGDETLPSDAALTELDNKQDDEKWLDIAMEDLDHELGGSKANMESGQRASFGDKAQQENLQRIVQQFESFLNDKDGSSSEATDDADDLDDLDVDDELETGEDKEASFDEDEFTKMMQEMMGMPPEVMKEIMLGDIDAVRDQDRSSAAADVRGRGQTQIDEVDTSEEEDIMDMKKMEAELRASGALDLHRGTSTAASRSAIRDGFSVGSTQHNNGPLDDAGDNDDFDVTFVRNIVASFRSSGGSGGPAASLLSMMEDRASGSSSKQERHE